MEGSEKEIWYWFNEMKKKREMDRGAGSEVTFFNDTGKTLNWHPGTEKEIREAFKKGLPATKQATVAVGSNEKIFIKIWENNQLLICQEKKQKDIESEK